MAENQIGTVFVSQQPAGIPAVSKPFPLGAGRDKFGLGFQIASQSEDATKYRRAGSLSWAGLLNTEFWVDPRSGIAGALLISYAVHITGDHTLLRPAAGWGARDCEAIIW